jgi:hypothetical protein
MRGPAIRFLAYLGTTLAACLLVSTARAEGPNDLREFRLGMTVGDLPRTGYVGLSCAAASGQELPSWQEYRQCPVDASGRREVRFRYDNSLDPMARVNESHEGTRVGGHPALISLLIGDDGRVDGLRIVTDPKAPLYMHKKAFLLGLQAKARYGEEGWSCTEGQSTADEAPVGGVFLKEHCEKTTPTRHVIIDRDLFRDPDQKDPKAFVNDTKIAILPPG